MPRMGKADEAFHKAVALEKKYDWARAADSYKQVLNAVGKSDFLKKGEIQEKIGYCLQRAAFQAESQGEFREKTQRAVEANEEALGFFENLTDEPVDARVFRCRAFIKHLSYWLVSDPSEKKRFLDECLELEIKALTGFSESGDMLEYGKTYNALWLVPLLRGELEWEGKILEQILERHIGWGQKAIVGLSKLENSYEITRTHLTLAPCMTWHRQSFIEKPEEKEKYRLRTVKYLREALEFSERTGDAFLSGLSSLFLGDDTTKEERIECFKKGLEYGKQTRDRLLIAYSLMRLSDEAFGALWEAEDPDRMRKLAEDAIRLAHEAQHHYSTIGGLPLWGSSSVVAECYFTLAIRETEPRKRLELLNKAEEAGIQSLVSAEAADIPIHIFAGFHAISKILEAQAQLRTDASEKRTLLEKALRYREKSIRITEETNPFSYWLKGVEHNYLAEIKAQLAEIEPEVERKRGLLEEAVTSKEKCLEQINKIMPYYERLGSPGLLAAFQRYQDGYVKLLVYIHDLTGQPQHMRKAVEVSEKTIESAKKAGMISRVAESQWKIAGAQDTLKEHLEAAESFKQSSESYLEAAKKIPQLKEFYEDHALYMEAWSEIQKARHHHAERKYGKAKEHYERAASLHESTERWKHLAPNYLAWARLEEAEDLSRKEQTEEARDLFRQAVGLFVEAEQSMQLELEQIESMNEKRSSIALAKTKRTRMRIKRRYCRARVALEEARIHDRQGDHVASSRKYGSAVERFREIFDATNDESERQELKPIIYLSQAWQMMTEAEAEASADLYMKASKLFEDAKNHSYDEKAKLLALGHSRFCKALEAGTRFEDVRDKALHKLATQHLESAATYYLKAGFKGASEYAEATQKLLDAYLYMHNATVEADPTKKARFYMMAEKVLQASAGSYLKAKHPEKQEQVSKLLEKVRREGELALSLTEVLHAPVATSTTATFTTPTPGEEAPRGLERFEHADIQATLFPGVREASVGQDIELEIELVNVGKAPALLIKVQKVIPEEFEIRKTPQIYKVEGSFINMKGRKLAPLKTEEIRLVLRPTNKGTYTLQPRVMYLDETGEYKSHEPEPVTITVKELGIKGWIKGEK